MTLSSKRVESPSLRQFSSHKLGYNSGVLGHPGRNKYWRITAPKMVLYLLAAHRNC